MTGTNAGVINVHFLRVLQFVLIPTFDAIHQSMAAFEFGGMPEKKAKSYVDHTLKICKQTLGAAQRKGQIWAGPIQGGEHEKLVKNSAKSLVKMGYEFLA